jgi:hypothetical protein
VNADAVKAAAERICARHHPVTHKIGHPCDYCRWLAEAAIGDGEPIIRAAIAAEIRAQAAAAGGADSDVAYGLAYAARIAEGTP